MEYVNRSALERQHQEHMSGHGDSGSFSQHRAASSKIPTDNYSPAQPLRAPSHRATENRPIEYLPSRPLSPRRYASNKAPTGQDSPAQPRRAPSVTVKQYRYSDAISEKVASNNLASWKSQDRSQHRQASVKTPSDEHVASKQASLHRQASLKIPSDNALPPPPQKAATLRAPEKQYSSPSPQRAKSHRHGHRSSKPREQARGDEADNKKKSQRLEDDERVPGLVWFFAGGTGMPPTGKQLRERKAMEEEYVARQRGEVVERVPRREARRGVAEEVAGGIDGQDTRWERRILEDYEKEKMQKIVERKLTRSGDW